MRDRIFPAAMTLALVLALALALITHAAPAQYPTRYQTQLQADGPAAFLALVNAERARFGRPPLAWDANLAAYASRNRGIHDPASRTPDSSQCWAGVGSYAAAARMWLASGPHRSILMNAVQAVGASTCPSGLTANAR